MVIGEVFSHVGGSNVTIVDGAGDDSVKNYLTSNVTIFGDAGNDNIYNKGSNVKIFGGAGNDSIHNASSNVTVDGGKGDDSIASSYDNVTISAGAGNDTIKNGGSDVKIDCGNGNDYIIDTGLNVTMNGGEGDDTFSLGLTTGKRLIKYASGDGNDKIFGFNSTDTLYITKGKYFAKAVDDDVVVTVGKSKITLWNAVGKQISIKNSKGKVTTKTYGSSSSQTSELFAENNFATADNLSEIVKNNLVAMDCKIEAQNFENLTQKNDLITFAEK